jgi:predicted dehydrogenase
MAIDLERVDLKPTPDPPKNMKRGIGIVGAGFITRDCHIPAYQQAGFHVHAITSRTIERAREVATARGVRRVYQSIEEMLDDESIEIVDVAVPPGEQPGVIERIAAHRRRVRGILAQKPLAMSYREARRIVDTCARAGIALQVNQNMRYDQSIRALKTLLDLGVLGEPVLATIELRAIPHWMPWARDGRSLSSFVMSIHHIDTFRYWLGDPIRVLASARPDPRTRFDHLDGINLYIFEFIDGSRASAWDDVWAGPAREGAGADLSVRWRFEGTRGAALGTIGWPKWPEHAPSTIDFTSIDDTSPGVWRRPRWNEAWFPEAFAGTMGGLLHAIENETEPDISGADNLGTIAACEAVLEAAQSHRVIDMPEFREYLNGESNRI